MAATYSFYNGDGITTDVVQLNVSLPDSNGGNALVSGTITPVSGSAINVGQTLALPTAPASGSIYFIIECNRSTGTCTLLQSTTGWPTLDPNNDAIFQDILTPTTTDPALDPNNQDL